MKGLGRRQGAVALRPAHQGEVSTIVRKKERVASSAKKRAALFFEFKKYISTHYRGEVIDDAHKTFIEKTMRPGVRSDAR